MSTPDENHTTRQPQDSIARPLSAKSDPAPGEIVTARPATLLRVTDSEWRIARNEIAEELSKNWRFKLQVAGIVIAIPLAILGVLGYKTLSDARTELVKHIDSELNDAKTEMGNKIGSVKTAMAEQIATEFKDPGIQKTIQEVAAEQSKNLLSGSVQPSIDSFNKRVEDRLTTFDVFLKEQQKLAAQNLESLKTELEKLKRRNEIVSLGDKIVAQGDVQAFKNLEKIADDPLEKDTELHDVAISEIVRAYSAYSFASPTRIGGIKLNVPAINPKKTKEEELDAAEIIPFLKTEESPLGRAKIAEILSRKSISGSFKTAEAIVTAMQSETNLEAMRYLINAFKRAANYDQGGKLDGTTELKWWEEHKEELRTKDTDKPAEPTK